MQAPATGDGEPASRRIAVAQSFLHLAVMVLAVMVMTCVDNA
jgi:hypothetical protein